MFIHLEISWLRILLNFLLRMLNHNRLLNCLAKISNKKLISKIKTNEEGGMTQA